MTEVQKALFSLKDQSYWAFHTKLIPNVDPATVIGVRTPQLRKFAKEFAASPSAAEFMRQLPHRYYEENNLQVYLIEPMRDLAEALAAVEAFLPYVDNWATCDAMNPRVFKAHHAELLPHVKRWVASEHEYTIRFGMEMLMLHYLEEDFSPEFPAMVAAVTREEYYIRMMVAWYFATALAFQWEACIGYLEQQKLPRWTHNKTIQKAIESYRITEEQKKYLRALRIR